MGAWDGRHANGEKGGKTYAAVARQVVTENTLFCGLVVKAVLDGLGIVMIEMEENKQPIIWGRKNYDEKVHPLLVKTTLVEKTKGKRDDTYHIDF